MSENTAQDFLFGGMEADDSTMSVFDKKSSQSDGIYRPSLNDAKDKAKGYVATIRFLPNLLDSGKIGPSAIEKHIHYVDLKNEPALAGYYDCNKNNEPDCPLCTEYWKLKNSKNAADNEKSSLLKRSTKYYSYVQIIEDEQHPDLVGSIMIYGYGYTIKEKINSERQGEVSGVPCNVFDLANGKSFRLIIKEKGGYSNYDASQFLDIAPVQIFNEKNETFVKAPSYTNDKGKTIIGFDGDAKKTAGVHKKITSFLQDKKVNMYDYEAKKWDEQITGKVNNILAILSGDIDYKATQQVNNVKTDATTNTETETFNSEPTNADDFFDLED